MDEGELLLISVTESLKTVIPRRYHPAARKLHLTVDRWLRRRALYRWLRVLPYRGNEVCCPCCGGSFRCFISYGPMRNGMCPCCDSLDRHRMLWLYLHNRTSIFRDRLKVLHFAPEPAIQKRLRASPNLEYTSADLDSPLAMVSLDITDMPYAENTFDVVLCSHVLEHILDDRKAMSELYRILRPEGWALLLVPFDAARSETFEDPNVVDPKERERLFGQFDHVRVYGRDFKDRLEHAGFTVRQEFYAQELGLTVAQRHGLLVEVDMFYCTKPNQLQF
jgi:predicted SAM-dependent methyltransferase